MYRGIEHGHAEPQQSRTSVEGVAAISPLALWIFDWPVQKKYFSLQLLINRELGNLESMPGLPITQAYIRS
jgi:hypothetical protein